MAQSQAASVRLSTGDVVWESALPASDGAASPRRYAFELGELRGELTLWGGVAASAETTSELQPEVLAALASFLQQLSSGNAAPLEAPDTEGSETLPPLSAALSHFGDGVAVLSSAGIGELEPRILHLNSAWLHQTGFTAPELSGQPLWSLLGPETPPQTLDRLRESVRLGHSVRAQVPRLHKGGHSVWADLSLSPVRDGRGALTHWLAHWSAARRKRVPDSPRSPTSDSPGTDRAQVWELAANNAPLVQVLARLVDSVERQFEGQRAVIVVPEEPPTIFTARGEANQSGWLTPGTAASAAQWTQPIASSTGHLLGTLRVHGQTDAAPDADARAKLEAAAGLAALVMERSASQAVLERLALYDALTGLPNRALFERELERALNTETLPTETGGEQPIGVGLMDLDRFKTINDTLGHSVGDALLQQVAVRLQGALEPGDLLARMGGDEFLLLMGRAATPQQVQQVAGRLLHTFSQPFVLAGREIFMQLSVGFSVLPRRSARTELLIQQADSAMYQAKRQGGGYALYRTGADEPLTAMTLESGLHRALERREFRLEYQPQLDTRTGELVGAEALLRWQHPELGLILPGEFIPLAEVTGLIVPIGAWVLRQACLQAAAWVTRVPHLRMAVNLSARQFQRPDLIETVTRALTAAGLEAHHLELELTESMLVQAQHAETTLERLKDLGVRVVVDDFGTGYSNLAYLKQYPIDALKIDATFTAKVGGDLAAAIRDEVLVKAVMNLAHALDLAVTVEGVERPEQLDFLRRHNCDYVQGYLLGPPQEAESLMRAFPQLAPPAVSDPLV
ncbi:EAL domain-containing protein [Deinococcus sp. Arct2-2]|uniref:putative bifunctional diguanylate cyclase/phosphodiesterase n=1 Tax=Deinococcus sp. Arct2-2 TaxID=2568653 RepID=UPI0010A5878B|nr:GGDEF domain-containing protein [Deinococcus sp. Arct2-2]THF69535.1 EAL domain-containing protein [Deinococcus sp. Arct2-2]